MKHTKQQWNNLQTDCGWKENSDPDGTRTHDPYINLPHLLLHKPTYNYNRSLNCIYSIFLLHPKHTHLIISCCGLDYFFTILKILQVINETYHGVQVINFTNLLFYIFTNIFNLGISCIVSTPFMNNFIVFSFLCAISANTNINHKYSI